MYKYIITIIFILGSIFYFIKSYSVRKQKNDFIRLLIWAILFITVGILSFIDYFNRYIIIAIIVIFLVANYINDSINISK